MVAGAGLVAGAALLVVYLGLTYLGVTTSRFFDLSVLRTFLIVSIVRNLLGGWGIVLFSVVVALACVTTAVALVSSSADYFSALSGGRVSYRAMVVGICVFSAVVSNFGLEQIVAIAGPVLDVVYPPTLALILLALVQRWIPGDWTYRLAALAALAVSLLGAAAGQGLPCTFVNALPLASFGLGWLLPAAVGAVLGCLVDRQLEKA